MLDASESNTLRALVDKATSGLPSIDALRLELLATGLSTSSVDELVNNIKQLIAQRMMTEPAPVVAASTAARSPMTPVPLDEQFVRPGFLPTALPTALQLRVSPDRWGFQHSQYKQVMTHLKADVQYQLKKANLESPFSI